jgi:hypothetical protein
MSSSATFDHSEVPVARSSVRVVIDRVAPPLTSSSVWSCLQASLSGAGPLACACGPRRPPVRRTLLVPAEAGAPGVATPLRSSLTFAGQSSSGRALRGRRRLGFLPFPVRSSCPCGWGGLHLGPEALAPGRRFPRTVRFPVRFVLRDSCGWGRAPVPGATLLPCPSSPCGGGGGERGGLGSSLHMGSFEFCGPHLSGFPSRLGSSFPVSGERSLAPPRSSTRSGRFRPVASRPVASTPRLSSTGESVAFVSIAGGRTPYPSMGFFPLRGPSFTVGSEVVVRFRMSPSVRFHPLLPHPSLVRPGMRYPVRVAAVVVLESVRWGSCAAVVPGIRRQFAPPTGSKVSLRR